MTTEKLLLVDDDDLVRSTFGKGLTDHGYKVCLADNGNDAIRIACEDTSLDLAILDMRMPGLSGIETAKALQKVNIPVIFLSAYGDEVYVKQAVADGALAYMVKPIDVEKAIPTIDAALQRAKEIQVLRETETRLDGALKTGNLVNVVVGILMERHKICREAAFEILRKQARSEQRKVKELADEMLKNWSRFNP